MARQGADLRHDVALPVFCCRDNGSDEASPRMERSADLASDRRYGEENVVLVLEWCRGLMLVRGNRITPKVD